MIGCLEMSDCNANFRHIQIVSIIHPYPTIMIPSSNIASSAGTSTNNSIGNVVICGAGVIGTSIAYHLAKLGTPSTVIDPIGLAPAASGKAGGFLALDWNAGPMDELSRRSFYLHEVLAKELGLDDKCYRRLTCEAVAVDGSDRKGILPSQKKLQSVDWADIGVLGSRCIGTKETIAQTHPKTFVEALWRESQKMGCSMTIGKVEDVLLENATNGEKKQKCTGVKLSDGTEIIADIVVIAMGPWSSQLPSLQTVIPQMYGQKYHSAILKPDRVLDQAVFFQGLGDPEVYPRPDGDVYVCGFPDSPIIVTERPGAVEVRPEAVQRLVDVSGKVSTELRDAGVVYEKCSSCYLPITENGMPLMGPLPSISGAFIATGHSCWGILNAPASGEAMAELITYGKTNHVDLTNFLPDA